MRVWITRSEPGASRVAARLAEAGYQCLVAPVLAVEPVDPGALAGGEPAISDAVFLSEHAVAPGLAALERAGIALPALRAFAVGLQTAARLAESGVHALVPPLATSEGLLAMDELGDVAGRRFVVLAGEGGLDRLRQGLLQRGAQVTRLALYRRVPVPVARVRAALEPQHIDAIAVASGDGFRWAAQVWFAAQGRSDVAVLAPSARVAGAGQELGFSRVVTCRGADADALIDGLANFAG